MDEKLKYRLVGASVILALAVFFLPMILDSEKYRSQIQSQIPEIPSSHKPQNLDIDDSENNQVPEMELDGPVEKGPLVINLDDSEETKQPQKVAPASDQIPEKVEQIDTEHVIKSPDPQSVDEQVVSEKPKEQPKAEVVDKTESQSKPKDDIESVSKSEVKEETSKQLDNAVAVKDEDAEQTSESELAFSDTAWLIQIGSFSNKDNATRLVGQLRNEGYRAYQRVGDSFARVYVGPYPVKGEAESRISALEKLVGAKVKVIEFDPKQH